MAENNKSEYDIFMNEYAKLHACCPKCGHISYNTTLVGYILNLDKKHEYKDLNRCICSNCNDKHTRHERIQANIFHTLVSYDDALNRIEQLNTDGYYLRQDIDYDDMLGDIKLFFNEPNGGFKSKNMKVEMTFQLDILNKVYHVTTRTYKI